MTKPRVWSVRDQHPADAVYVGRPTKWGNPFKIGRDGTREEVVERFEHYLISHRSLFNCLPELKGKDLVCHCSPRACHADVLLRLANKDQS